jgi:hypothetical protein
MGTRQARRSVAVRAIALAVLAGFDQVALAIRPHDLDDIGIVVRIIFGIVFVIALIIGG